MKTRMLNSARARARRRGVPFNLTIDDLYVPAVCPVLGIPLEFGHTQINDHSPSLDRLRPEFGYVRGNVVVLSMRANRIKNDAQLHELKALVAFLEERLSRGWMVPQEEPPHE